MASCNKMFLWLFFYRKENQEREVKFCFRFILWKLPVMGKSILALLTCLHSFLMLLLTPRCCHSCPHLLQTGDEREHVATIGDMELDPKTFYTIDVQSSNCDSLKSRPVVFNPFGRPEPRGCILLVRGTSVHMSAQTAKTYCQY